MLSKSSAGTLQSAGDDAVTLETRSGASAKRAGSASVCNMCLRSWSLASDLLCLGLLARSMGSSSRNLNMRRVLLASCNQSSLERETEICFDASGEERRLDEARSFSEGLQHAL